MPDYHHVASSFEKAAAMIRAQGCHGLSAAGQSATPPWVSALLSDLGPVLIAILQSLLTHPSERP